MRYPEVTRLFKYHVFDERSLALLIDRSIWASKPKDLNDPFEVKRLYNPNELPTDEILLKFQAEILKTDGQSNTEIGKQIVELANKLKTKKGASIKEEWLKLLNDVLRPLNNEIGIYSLSRCYETENEVLMWSHYSGNYTGFVIGFERNPGNATQEFIEDTFKLDYVDLTFPSINETSGDGIGDVAYRPSLLKSEAWIYEDEYRIMYTEGNKYYAWPGLLESITFGLRMSERNKMTIYNALLDFHEIRYYNTSQPTNRLSLKYEPIDNPEAYFRDYADRVAPAIP